jgi:hypothetical protein
VTFTFTLCKKYSSENKKIYWHRTRANNAGIFRIKKTGYGGKLKKPFIKLAG